MYSLFLNWQSKLFWDFSNLVGEKGSRGTCFNDKTNINGQFYVVDVKFYIVSITEFMALLKEFTTGPMTMPFEVVNFRYCIQIT